MSRHDMFVWCMLGLFVVVMVVGSFTIKANVPKSDDQNTFNMTNDEYVAYILKSQYHADSVEITRNDTYKMDEEYIYNYYTANEQVGKDTHLVQINFRGAQHRSRSLMYLSIDNVSML